MMNHPRDPQTYAIIGAAMTVHRELGPGFLESVYQEAMTIEFDNQHIPYVREPELSVWYKNRQLNTKFRADFICYNRVVVELKAIKCLTTSDDAQAINYLKATKHTVSILLNFGEPSLVYRRLVHDHPD